MEKMLKLTLGLLVLSGASGLMSAVGGRLPIDSEKVKQAVKEVVQKGEMKVQDVRDYVKTLDVDQLTQNLGQHKENIEKALQAAHDCMIAKHECIKTEMNKLTPAERVVAKLWFWKHMNEMKQQWAKEKKAIQEKVAHLKGWVASEDGKAFMAKVQPMIDAVKEKMEVIQAKVAQKIAEKTDSEDEDTVIGSIIAYLTPDSVEIAEVTEEK